MAQIELTVDEIMYLEVILRRVQGRGEKTEFDEHDDLAQKILDKLEDTD